MRYKPCLVVLHNLLEARGLVLTVQAGPLTTGDLVAPFAAVCSVLVPDGVTQRPTSAMLSKLALRKKSLRRHNIYKGKHALAS